MFNYSGHKWLPFKEMNNCILQDLQNGATLRQVGSHYQVAESFVVELSQGRIKGFKAIPKPLSHNDQTDWRKVENILRRVEEKIKTFPPPESVMFVPDDIVGVPKGTKLKTKEAQDESAQLQALQKGKQKGEEILQKAGKSRKKSS